MILDISAKYARLAYYFQSRGVHDHADTRLQCVRVEPHPDGAVIVATNGYCMFVGIDSSGDCSDPMNLNISVPMHCLMKPAELDSTRLVLRKNQYLQLKYKGDKDTWGAASSLSEDQSRIDWRKPIPSDLSELNVHFPAVLSGYLLGLIGRLQSDIPDLRDIVFLGHNEDPHRSCMAHFPQDPSLMLLMAPLKMREAVIPKEVWIDKFHLTGRRVDDDL